VIRISYRYRYLFFLLLSKIYNRSWVLLDIKVKEQSDENLARGRKIYEPPRFMSCQQAAQQLLEAIQNQPETSTPEVIASDSKTPGGLLLSSSQVVCVARVGATDQRIVACSLEEAATLDMGKPLHSLVIPGMSWSIFTN
jgi:diphthine methyl ester synthase